jgi:glutathione synthase
MRVGIIVNDIATEVEGYTTTHIAMTAVNQGHAVWYFSVGDFALRPDDHVYAHARAVPQARHRSPRRFLEHLRSEGFQSKSEIDLNDLDVLLLRNDPSLDAMARPWARMAAINFAHLAMRSNVVVLNDPVGLSLALTKLYMEYFPEEVRPRTLVTRDKSEAKDFIASEGGCAVLKPLFGSGGHNVFLVRPHDTPNINQMLEAVSQEGYVIVQEYLHDAIHGDTRLLLMNGEPLRCKGKIAAIHRRRKTGDADIRSNMAAGAIAVRANVTDSMLRLAELVRPRLVEDGIFFAGLDIVGDKIMEINVQSPGGIDNAQELEGVPFLTEIIRAIERKVAHRMQHPDRFSNRELATL